jgi:glycosyltransferase involved in cell wall biosynthesis
VTSYIGSSHAGRFPPDKSGPLLPDPKRATLTYLGYARHDKGFFFLLDAVEKLPKNLADRITLQLAVRINGDKKMKSIILQKCRQLQGMKLFDGYTHAELREILAGTSLGIVPVLWEDNLPQVALEMHCYGVPLLCSNLGGAAELANNPDFVFEASSIENFTQKLDRILNNGTTHEQYWKNARRPMGLEEHANRLIAEYEDITG